MLSLCFSGLLIGLVGILMIIFGLASLIIVQFFYKHGKDSVKIYKVSKIFTLAVAYYGIAVVVYLILMSISNNLFEYTTCSGKESIELFVILAYVISTIVMINSVKNSENTERFLSKTYVQAANVLVVSGLLLIIMLLRL